jgi:RNA polymerase sigma-70 factor (ECF subfamily)
VRTDAEVAQAYDDHGGELFAVAVRSLGDRERAADAVQETFVRAWRARERFDPTIASLRTWLHAINRNVVIDQLRASAVRPRLAAVDGVRLERSAPPTAPDESIVDRELLAAAIRVLPEDQRRAILAVHYEGHTAADHARSIGVPAGTVRSWVHRGLCTLRTELAGGLADA